MQCDALVVLNLDDFNLLSCFPLILINSQHPLHINVPLCNPDGMHDVFEVTLKPKP